MSRRRKKRTFSARYHVLLALRQVSHAAGKLRDTETRECLGGHGMTVLLPTSPAEYYELNRVWAQLDSLAKRMVQAGKASR